MCYFSSETYIMVIMINNKNINNAFKIKTKLHELQEVPLLPIILGLSHLNTLWGEGLLQV